MNFSTALILLFAWMLLPLLYVFAIRSIIHQRKIRKLYALIRDWFDLIDASNIIDLDPFALAAKERRIDEFIRNHLRAGFLAFPPRFRRRFLRSLGFIKAELVRNQDLFEQCSLYPASGIPVDVYWGALRGGFYQFKGDYGSKSPVVNFGEIKTRVRLLAAWCGDRGF